MPPMKDLMHIVEQGYESKVEQLSTQMMDEARRHKEEIKSWDDERKRYTKQIDEIKKENALYKQKEYDLKTEIEVLQKKVDNLESREPINGTNVEAMREKLTQEIREKVL